MGYNDFFEREDVYGIISKTLIEYYKCNIYFSNKYIAEENCKNFYCLPKLNVIFNEDINKLKLIKFLISTNIGNQFFMKKMAILVYIYISVLLPKIFFDNILIFKNTINYPELIFPGNKRIKVINFKEHTITNILKFGFNNHWFIKDVNFRLRHLAHYILKIKRYNYDNSFEENLLNGKTLSRISNKKKRQYINKVFLYLDSFSNRTKIVSLKEYSYSLVNDIKDKIYKTKIINKNLAYIISIVYNFLKNKETEIIIDFTHGDLQEGNIFITNFDDIYILDWETYDIRFKDYDKLILYYQLRNTNNLINNLLSVLNSNNYYNRFKIKNRVELICLFVLEDLKWHLDETMELSNDYISLGITNYCKANVIKFLKGLVNNA